MHKLLLLLFALTAALCAQHVTYKYQLGPETTTPYTNATERPLTLKFQPTIPNLARPSQFELTETVRNIKGVKYPEFLLSSDEHQITGFKLILHNANPATIIKKVIGRFAKNGITLTPALAK